MSERLWSPQQSAIFDWFAVGTGNLVVRARAGTERVQVDGHRGGAIATEVCGADAPDPMIGMVRKLAGLGKGIAPITALDERPSERLDDNDLPISHGVLELESIAEEFDCIPDKEWEDDGWDTLHVARMAQRAMRAALHKTGEIDFDDMIFIPVASGWVRPDYDMVVVDEAQDMNAAQILLARGSCRGRIAVVGDDRQAIYGFRGADSTSIDRLKAELRAVELPLTITYRCPRAIVALAADIVPDYTAAPGAPVGVVTACPSTAIPKLCVPGDFVLSRKNAPLTGICLAILRSGKRAKIEGKDIGERLVGIVRKLKAKSIPDLLTRLGRWLEKESARAMRTKHPEEKIDKLKDEVETICGLAAGLSGPRELETRIEALFDDSEGDGNVAVVCSSIHRSKDLESDRVFLLVDTLYPRKRNDIEERNIHYVGLTRAKRELTLVSGLEP